MNLYDFNSYLVEHRLRVSRGEATLALQRGVERDRSRFARKVVPLREAITVRHGELIRGPWPEPPVAA